MSKHKESEGSSFFHFIIGVVSLLSVFFVLFLFLRRASFSGQKDGFALPESSSEEGGLKKKAVFKKVNRIVKKTEKKENLNERQEKILGLLQRSGEITVDFVMKDIKGVSERTLRRDMNILEGLGHSKKIGSTKGSKYIFVK